MKSAIRSLLSGAALSLLGFPTLANAETCAPESYLGAISSADLALCQNWNDSERQEFWYLPQGSEIIPYVWFNVLEQAGSEALFKDNGHMDSFRYIPQTPTLLNPDGLPIGFTRDRADPSSDYGEVASHWLGMTCAACHTNKIEFGGKGLLIDGGPAMADFEGFMTALVEAMQVTLDDAEKFDRFADRVLDRRASDEGAREELRTYLDAMVEIRRSWNDRNRGDHAYGFARLDAIGAIFNEVAVSALGLPDNVRRANAPVSYPFIWDTPQHDRVQWNGSVENKGAGALSRNVGEVLGVFGQLELNTSIFRKNGHTTSVDIPNLGHLEALLWKLWSPKWPETVLPEIKHDVAMSDGRPLYIEHCARCHGSDFERDKPDRRIKAKLIPLDMVGTDPAMATNFLERRFETGKLENRSKIYVTSPFLFDETTNGGGLLRNAVIGTIIRGIVTDPVGTIKAIQAGRENGLAAESKPRDMLKKLRSQFDQGNGGSESKPAYKARPLNGIWATAPYLHNGSVRTLEQLLLPPDQRETEFQVGNRDFDHQAVGFKSSGSFRFDTTLPGNSKTGHDFGTSVLGADKTKRDALLEYLKTL